MFDPAPIARVFRFDSGIRLRRTKNSAIVAGLEPHVEHTMGFDRQIGLSPATFVALEARFGPDAPPNSPPVCPLDYRVPVW